MRLQSCDDVHTIIIKVSYGIGYCYALAYLVCYALIHFFSSFSTYSSSTTPACPLRIFSRKKALVDAFTYTLICSLLTPADFLRLGGFSLLNLIGYLLVDNVLTIGALITIAKPITV